MSSTSDFLASLTIGGTNLYKYGGPILMALGTASGVLSLLVFTQKNLRKNPCSIYLIAYNISNLFLIYTSILIATLSTGYLIDPSLYNLTFCRLHFYTMMFFDVISPSFLLLASVDRILFTSPNALTRQRSTTRLAYTCIIMVTLFWMICHSHALIFTNIIGRASGFTLCYFQAGVHLAVVSYYTLIMRVILVPSMMVILGLWTVRNVRSLVRVTPVTILTTVETQAHVGLRSVRSKDRQLIKILLIDTSVYIIFTILMSVVLIYQQFSTNQSQNYVEAQIAYFILYLGVFSSYIPSCIGCYTNLFVSKTFRQEVRKVLMGTKVRNLH